MNDPTKSPVEAPRTNGGQVPPVEDQLAKLRTDVEKLKTESKSWVKTWGVYLGMLGALVAVPKGALDLLTQLWKKPDTSVMIQEVTIYDAKELSSKILTFPLVVMNLGNRDDVLLESGGSLTVAGHQVPLTEKDFGLYDHGNKIQMPLVVPKDAVLAYDVSVTFDPKALELATKSGQLELHFPGVNQSYSASFCFPLQDSDVNEVSAKIPRKNLMKQCPA